MERIPWISKDRVYGWGLSHEMGNGEIYLYPKICPKCRRSTLKIKYGISVGWRNNRGECYHTSSYCIKCAPGIIKKIIAEHEMAHTKKIKKYTDLLRSIEGNP